MPTPSGLVTKQELIDAQLDTAHLGRVVNSKDAAGNPISQSTNRTGGVNATLNALLGAIGLYSVGFWTDDPTLTEVNQYVRDNSTGLDYQPVTLPYTVNSTLNPDPETLVTSGVLKRVNEVTQQDLIDQLGLLVGGSVYPGDDGAYVKNGDTVPSSTTHLIVQVGGVKTLVAMSPVASGAVSSISDYTATIGGVDVFFIPINPIESVHLSSFGYGKAGNTPQENYAALGRFYEWCQGQSSIGVIKHPPYEVEIDANPSVGSTTFLGSDLTSVSNFIFDFNGGKLKDVSDVSTANTQHVLFVVRNADNVVYRNADIEGTMPLPETTRRGMTLCRAYDCNFTSFKGKAKGILNHLETRDCNFLEIKGDFDTVRYPFLEFRCKSFDVTINNKNCWRDYFIQGSSSGSFNVVSDAPRQHSMIKSYSTEMVNENIKGFYKARNRPLSTILTPTGQFGFEIESDEQALFRNIDLTVDIEGKYERPFMMRNFKSDASPQTVAKGHAFQNVKIKGRVKDTSGNTGNLFLLGGGYFSGDYIQNFNFEGLTVVGSFVINLSQIIPAVGAESKIKWKDFTLTDAYLENHDQAFYEPYLVAENVNFPGKAYSSNNVQECGVLKFTKKFIGDISAGIPIFTTDGTRTFNQIIVNYCATVSDTTFNPFAEGRLSGLVVYPSSGTPAEFVVDTQYSASGTTGVAEIYEVSNGQFGFKIPEWVTATSGMVQIDAVINYSSYGEDDFSSIPGLVYEPYRVL